MVLSLLRRYQMMICDIGAGLEPIIDELAGCFGFGCQIQITALVGNHGGLCQAQKRRRVFADAFKQCIEGFGDGFQDVEVRFRGDEKNLPRLVAIQKQRQRRRAGAVAIACAEQRKNNPLALTGIVVQRFGFVVLDDVVIFSAGMITLRSGQDVLCGDEGNQRTNLIEA
jgi:hypothetical protein